MKIIDGRKISEKIKAQIRDEIDREYISKKRAVPTLAVVIVGNNPASEIYVKSKQRASAEVGIGSVVVRLSEECSEGDVVREIEKLNRDTLVNAILVQLPLPTHINSRNVINSIAPQKDVDALCDINIGRLVSRTNIIAPCTSAGIMELLKSEGILIESQNVVVLGRSLLVGRPTEIMLSNENATTTICHSRTREIEKVTRRADILISAIGKPNFVKRNMVKKGCVVIDVGINRTNGRLCGDVDFEDVKSKVSFITPVPGGVGPMTIALLLKNTLTLAKNNSNQA